MTEMKRPEENGAHTPVIDKFWMIKMVKENITMMKEMDIK